MNLPTPLPILANITDFISPLLDEVFVATDANIDVAIAKDTGTTTPLIRAMAALLSANAFLTSNANCSISAIAADLNTSLSLARQQYIAATTPGIGETSSDNFEVSRLALLNGIDLRAQVAGGFAGAGPDFDFADAIIPGPGKIIDDRVRDAALDILKPGPSVCPFN